MDNNCPSHLRSSTCHSHNKAINSFLAKKKCTFGLKRKCIREMSFYIIQWHLQFLAAFLKYIVRDFVVQRLFDDVNCYEKNGMFFWNRFFSIVFSGIKNRFRYCRLDQHMIVKYFPEYIDILDYYCVLLHHLVVWLVHCNNTIFHIL